MPDFGIFRGFNDKLFGNKLYAGQLPTQLGLIGSINLLPYLLDLFPNASAAYSLRRLNSAYKSNLIRVRRSSDNTEQDIGFTATGNLDTTALTTFCGAGNGFVTTWYDQSGNANNATQTTAANQPQIVSSGSVILENTKPTISWLSGLSGLDFTTFSASSVTMFMVIKAKNDPALTQGDSGFVTFGTSTSLNHYPFIDGNIYEGSFSTVRHTIGNPTTLLSQLNLYNAFSKSGNYTSYLNGTQIFTTSTNTVGINSSPKIGSKSTTAGMNSFLSELIIYPSDESSNRTGIQTNINSYYALY